MQLGDLPSLIEDDRVALAMAVSPSEPCPLASSPTFGRKRNQVLIDVTVRA